MFFEFVVFECKLLIVSLMLPSGTLSVQHQSITCQPVLNHRCECSPKQDVDHRLGKWQLVACDYTELFIDPKEIFICREESLQRLSVALCNPTRLSQGKTLQISHPVWSTQEGILP